MNPTLTGSQIRAEATEQSFDRGEDYYLTGAVGKLAQRGDTITAEVEGSSWEPYFVEIDFDEGGVTTADCTCPYDWGGWCKHIVAVALTWTDPAQGIEQLPSLDELFFASR